jgi:hypothetical protein
MGLRWLVLALGLGGCVVPLAPQFEDPEENSAPYLVGADPSIGVILAGSPPEFRVTVADSNLGDTLYARFIIDYPDFDRFLSRIARGAAGDQIIPAPQDDNTVRQLRPYRPGCEDSIDGSLTQHRLMLVVSDRPFLAADAAPQRRQFDSVPVGALVLRVSWTFEFDSNLSCLGAP